MLGQLHASNINVSMVVRSRSSLARRVRISVRFRVISYATIRRMVQQECLSCGSTRLPQLLRASLTLDSTAARDKVYALLGHAENREYLGIVPDYTKRVCETYMEVTRSVLRTYGRLNFLCINTNSAPPLPS